MKTTTALLFAFCWHYVSAAADVSAGSSSPPAPTNAPSASAKGFEKQLLGATLVADRSMNNIDQFRTLGMQNGFGQNEPLCDFIATEKWVNKYGPSIKAGDKVKIGKVTVVEATDGYGNTGTKLILDTGEPKEGLVFYCYAFNRDEKAYWAIDKEKISQALKGTFHFENQSAEKHATPTPGGQTP